ncbi:hypothetical protein OIE13_31145 [Streptosporangium sp. NBC_01810]|uniref:hypothetical protein n=1 Tax=Streptosporangium sp. NBC_01810 TaxID=2975951 RepID=UPI002DD94525|nr:hypothetical protein [Streptosporangium sp. NBC_01810]WSA25331.1 hypothetical protein OIE13_31145 [Streptosporangium sp. NBC_01810]
MTTHRWRNERRGLLNAAVLATCVAAPMLAWAPPLSALSTTGGVGPPAPQVVQHAGKPISASGRSAHPEPETDYSTTASQAGREPGYPATPPPEMKAEPDYPTAPPRVNREPGDPVAFPIKVKPEPDYPTVFPPETDHPKEPPKKPGYPADIPVKPEPEPKPKPKPTPEPEPESPTPTAPSPTPPPPSPSPTRPRPLPPAPPAYVPKAVVTPTPPRTRPPRPAPATRHSAPPLLRQRLVLDRYAERRKGTDRRLVLLVMFTGVISVTAVAALNHRGRG